MDYVGIGEHKAKSLSAINIKVIKELIFCCRNEQYLKLPWKCYNSWSANFHGFRASLKPRNITFNEIQNFHIVILCQLWNHKYKRTHDPRKFTWTTKIGIHEQKYFHSIMNKQYYFASLFIVRYSFIGNIMIYGLRNLIKIVISMQHNHMDLINTA